jgi:hypothetical protein
MPADREKPAEISERHWQAIRTGRPLFSWPVTLWIEPARTWYPRFFCDGRPAREWNASWPLGIERRWRTFHLRVSRWYLCLTVAWWRDGRRPPRYYTESIHA